MSIQHIAFIYNSSLSYPDKIIKTRNKTKHTNPPPPKHTITGNPLEEQNCYQRTKSARSFSIGSVIKHSSIASDNIYLYIFILHKTVTAHYIVSVAVAHTICPSSLFFLPVTLGMHSLNQSTEQVTVNTTLQNTPQAKF